MAVYADIKHIIFDWNGTLIDDVGLAIKCVNKVRETQSLPSIDHGIYRENFSFPIREFYKKIGIDLKKLSFEELVEIYLGLFNKGIKECALHEGSINLLDWIRRSGMKVSILSASHHATLLDNLAYAGLYGHVDYIFGLDGSEAEGKLDLARRLDAVIDHPGSSALMIGDTDHDIEVARACGWRIASVSHGHQAPERLFALHQAVFPDLLSIFECHFPTARFHQ